MVRLGKLVRSCFASARGHRTNIIGALSEKEARTVLAQLLELAADADDSRQGYMARFARRVKHASGNDKAIKSLSRPEFIQLCNFLASMFVNTIPQEEFNVREWQEGCGALAT